MADERKTEVASVYFHINNGGIKFSVLQVERDYESDGEQFNSAAPALRIEAAHFGQQTNGMQFQLSPRALRLLGETMITASERVTLAGDPLVVEDPRRVRLGDESIELAEPSVECCS